jgi:hypothetical protein
MSFPVFSQPVFKDHSPVASGLHGADDDFLDLEANQKRRQLMSETKKADQEKLIDLFWKFGKCGITL